MSEKEWKTLTVIVVIIGLVALGIMLVLSRNPDGTVEFQATGTIITLLIVVLLSVAFNVFDFVQEKITKGINIKTFIYTILVMVGLTLTTFLFHKNIL